MTEDRETTRAFAGGAATLPAGLQLNGTYEIDRLIATGGMGEVYLGHVIETGDPVAIKVIRADMMGNEAAVTLFRKEASALHHLNHEAIIRYFVVAIDPGLGRPYLAMEFVEGEPLSEVIRRGGLSDDACFALIDRVASGLGAAHQIGIFHRDVSPDNVILPDGDVSRAKIIDFGIAKSTRLGAATVIGDGFAGKYSYVSPEQLGLFGGSVTERSDIYSLGLVIAEASAGKAIDMGQNHAETIERRRTLPSLDGVSPRLAPLVARMLEPMPEDRPASMAEVRALAAAARRGEMDARQAAPATGEPTMLLPRRERGRLRAMEPAPAIEREERAFALRYVAAGLVLLLLAAIPVALYVWPGFLLRPTDTASLDGDPYLPLPNGGTQRPGGGGTPQLRPSSVDTTTNGPGAADAEPDGPTTSPAGGLQPLDPKPAETKPADTRPAEFKPTESKPVDPRPVDPRPAVLPPSGSQTANGGAAGPAGLPPSGQNSAPSGLSLTPTGEAGGKAPAGQQPAGTGTQIASQTQQGTNQTQPTSNQPPEVKPPANTPEGFVARYPQTPCFLISLRNAGPGSAEIEAFGSEVKDIETFDKAFARAFGFEAAIQFRPITEPQCPAIEFLNRMPEGGGGASLGLDTFNPRVGQTVTGTVRGAGFKAVSALVVTEDGMVRALPARPDAGGQNTLITIEAEPGAAARRPKLVLVILSPRRPKAASFPGRVPARRVFGDLSAELAADREGVVVLRQYLRVEG